ncbi:MAG: rRNA maturation RNase YbeY [Legionellales bacterium]|jgi:probable rRNA maturation factor|nr:rRNA maturation RNase YbeY [Legionellales bacterium]
MTYHIDIQHACHNPAPVDDAMLTLWAETTLQSFRPAGEITLRLVEPEEIAALNHTYRQQNKPTNVLAFPMQLPAAVQMDCPLLGDVLICPNVLATEANPKKLQAHWAHIVIHGVLHILGYDHIQSEDARIMEEQEVMLLAKFGYDNPYSEDQHFE